MLSEQQVTVKSESSAASPGRNYVLLFDDFSSVSFERANTIFLDYQADFGPGWDYYLLDSLQEVTEYADNIQGLLEAYPHFGAHRFADANAGAVSAEILGPGGVSFATDSLVDGVDDDLLWDYRWEVDADGNGVSEYYFTNDLDALHDVPMPLELVDAGVNLASWGRMEDLDGDVDYWDAFDVDSYYKVDQDPYWDYWFLNWEDPVTGESYRTNEQYIEVNSGNVSDFDLDSGWTSPTYRAHGDIVLENMLSVLTPEALASTTFILVDGWDSFADGTTVWSEEYFFENFDSVLSSVGITASDIEVASLSYSSADSISGDTLSDAVTTVDSFVFRAIPNDGKFAARYWDAYLEANYAAETSFVHVAGEEAGKEGYPEALSYAETSESVYDVVAGVGWGTSYATPKAAGYAVNAVTYLESQEILTTQEDRDWLLDWVTLGQGSVDSFADYAPESITNPANTGGDGETVMENKLIGWVSDLIELGVYDFIALGTYSYDDRKDVYFRGSAGVDAVVPDYLIGTLGSDAGALNGLRLGQVFTDGNASLRVAEKVHFEDTFVQVAASDLTAYIATTNLPSNTPPDWAIFRAGAGGKTSVEHTYEPQKGSAVVDLDNTLLIVSGLGRVDGSIVETASGALFELGGGGTAWVHARDSEIRVESTASSSFRLGQGSNNVKGMAVFSAQNTDIQVIADQNARFVVDGQAPYHHYSNPYTETSVAWISQSDVLIQADRSALAVTGRLEVQWGSTVEVVGREAWFDIGGERDSGADGAVRVHGGAQLHVISESVEGAELGSANILVDGQLVVEGLLTTQTLVNGAIHSDSSLAPWNGVRVGESGLIVVNGGQINTTRISIRTSTSDWTGDADSVVVAQAGSRIHGEVAVGAWESVAVLGYSGGAYFELDQSAVEGLVQVNNGGTFLGSGGTVSDIIVNVGGALRIGDSLNAQAPTYDHQLQDYFWSTGGAESGIGNLTLAEGNSAINGVWYVDSKAGWTEEGANFENTDALVLTNNASLWVNGQIEVDLDLEDGSEWAYWFDLGQSNADPDREYRIQLASVQGTGQVHVGDSATVTVEGVEAELFVDEAGSLWAYFDGVDDYWVIQDAQTSEIVGISNEYEANSDQGVYVSIHDARFSDWVRDDNSDTWHSADGLTTLRFGQYWGSWGDFGSVATREWHITGYGQVRVTTDETGRDQFFAEMGTRVFGGAGDDTYHVDTQNLERIIYIQDFNGTNTASGNGYSSVGGLYSEDAFLWGGAYGITADGDQLSLSMSQGTSLVEGALRVDGYLTNAYGPNVFDFSGATSSRKINLIFSSSLDPETPSTATVIGADGEVWTTVAFRNLNQDASNKEITEGLTFDLAGADLDDETGLYHFDVVIPVTYHYDPEVWENTSQFQTTVELYGIDKIEGTDLADTFLGSDRDEEFRDRYVSGNFADGGGGLDTLRYEWKHFFPGHESGLRFEFEQDYSIYQNGLVKITDLGVADWDDPFQIEGAEDTATNFEVYNGTRASDEFLFADAENGSGGALRFFVNGLGGDDVIEGNGQTVLEYSGSEVAVQVDLAGGWSDARYEADKAESLYALTLGRDTFTGIGGVIGSNLGDLLQGSSQGVEWFSGLAGDDLIVGGGGEWDRVSYVEDPDGVVVDLRSGEATDGWGDTDTLVGINWVRGSDLGDTIYASDSLRHERLEGGAGADNLIGGDGYEDIFYVAASESVVFDLSAARVEREVDGVTYKGHLIEDGLGSVDFVVDVEGAIGSRFNDTLIGNWAGNRFDGGAGDDAIDGGGGDDWVSYSQDRSGVYVSLRDGEAFQGFDDWLNPASGVYKDTLVGIENVEGSGHNDFMIGDDNDNIFASGGGSDVIYGGEGWDTLMVEVDGEYSVTQSRLGEMNVVTVTAGEAERNFVLNSVEEVVFNTGERLRVDVQESVVDINAQSGRLDQFVFGPDLYSEVTTVDSGSGESTTTLELEDLHFIENRNINLSEGVQAVRFTFDQTDLPDGVVLNVHSPFFDIQLEVNPTDETQLIPVTNRALSPIWLQYVGVDLDKGDYQMQATTQTYEVDGRTLREVVVEFGGYVLPSSVFNKPAKEVTIGYEDRDAAADIAHNFTISGGVDVRSTVDGPWIGASSGEASAAFEVAFQNLNIAPQYAIFNGNHIQINFSDPVSGLPVDLVDTRYDSPWLNDPSSADFVVSVNDVALATEAYTVSSDSGGLFIHLFGDPLMASDAVSIAYTNPIPDADAIDGVVQSVTGTDVASFTVDAVFTDSRIQIDRQATADVQGELASWPNHPSLIRLGQLDYEVTAISLTDGTATLRAVVSDWVENPTFGGGADTSSYAFGRKVIQLELESISGGMTSLSAGDIVHVADFNDHSLFRSSKRIVEFSEDGSQPNLEAVLQVVSIADGDEALPFSVAISSYREGGAPGVGADFIGSDGADRAILRGGDHTVQAGDGDDTIYVGGGVSTVDGGAGYDTLVFWGDAGDYTFTVIDAATTRIEYTGEWVNPWSAKSVDYSGIEELYFYIYDRTGFVANHADHAVYLSDDRVALEPFEGSGGPQSIYDLEDLGWTIQKGDAGEDYLVAGEGPHALFGFGGGDRFFIDETAVGTNIVFGGSDWDRLTIDAELAFDYVLNEGLIQAADGSGVEVLLRDVGYVEGSHGSDTVTVSGAPSGLAYATRFEGNGGSDSIDLGVDGDWSEYSNRVSLQYYLAGPGGVDVSFDSATSATVTYEGGIDTLNFVKRFYDSNFSDVFDFTNFDADEWNFVELSSGDDTVIGGDSWTVVSLYEQIRFDGGVETHGQTGLVFDYAQARTDALGREVLVVDANHLETWDRVSLGVKTLIDVDAISGTRYSDEFYGDDSDNTFTGLGGGDIIFGGGGNDTARYDVSETGISVDLGKGLVRAIGEDPDAQRTGVDVIDSIERIVGSRFGDIYDASGFGRDPGFVTGTRWDAPWNTFEARGGDDRVIGNGFTGVDYTNASTGVYVNLAEGFSDAWAVVDPTRGPIDVQAYRDTLGRDSLEDVSGVRGSVHDDWIIGADWDNTHLGIGQAFGAGWYESFRLEGGDNYLDGGQGGFNSLLYHYYADGGIRADLEAGTVERFSGDVTGGFLVNTDTVANVHEVVGGLGSDLLLGSDGGTVLFSGAGLSEIFHGGDGSDWIDGRGGINKISFERHDGAVVIDLSDDTQLVEIDGVEWREVRDGFGNVDHVRNIQGIEGSDLDDRLTGDDQVNFLDGQHGSDWIDGGGGNDWVEYDGFFRGVYVNLAEGFAVEEYEFDGEWVDMTLPPLGRSVDTLVSIENVVGSMGSDYLIGDSGSNRFAGVSGFDHVFGGDGVDFVRLLGAAEDYTWTVDLASSSIDIAAKDGSHGVYAVDVERIEFADGTIQVFGNAEPTGEVTATGDFTQGQELLASQSLADIDGIPESGPGAIEFQWVRGFDANQDGQINESEWEVIPGAVGSTYTTTQADVGAQVAVVASYVDEFATPELVRSAGHVVANINDAPVGSVVVSGLPGIGELLTATNDLQDADGIAEGAIGYQWRRGVDTDDNGEISGAEWTDIPDATGSTYQLSVEDAGKYVSVLASYTDEQGTQESVQSNAVLGGWPDPEITLTQSDTNVFEFTTGFTGAVLDLNYSVLVAGGRIGQSGELAGDLSNFIEVGDPYNTISPATGELTVGGYSISPVTGFGDVAWFEVTAASGVRDIEVRIDFDEATFVGDEDPTLLESDISYTIKVGADVSVYEQDGLPLASSNRIEGDGSEGMLFSWDIELDRAVDVDHEIDWSVSGAGEFGVSAEDFAGGVLPSGTLQIAAGETTGTISFQVAGDGMVERDEGFEVTLSGTNGLDLSGVNTLGGMLLNDDKAKASIVAEAVTGAEGGAGETSTYTFEVELDQAVYADQVVQWQLVDLVEDIRGLASADDFAGALSGQVVFAAGETTQTVTIEIAGDLEKEGRESFGIELFDPSSLLEVPTEATTVQIKDDDGYDLGGQVYFWGKGDPEGQWLMDGVEVGLLTSLGTAEQLYGSAIFAKNLVMETATGHATVQLWADLADVSSISFDLAMAEGSTFESALGGSWSVETSEFEGELSYSAMWGGGLNTQTLDSVLVGTVTMLLPEEGASVGSRLIAANVANDASESRENTWEIPLTLSHEGRTSVIDSADPGNGTYFVASQAEGGYQLMFDKDVELRVDGTWSKEVRALTAADARETLLISLGKEVSGEALIAADVNKSGTVTAADARDILLMSVKDQTRLEEKLDWVFVSEDADLSGLTRRDVKEGEDWVQGRTLYLQDDQTSENLVAILMGDVNASYTPLIQQVPEI